VRANYLLVKNIAVTGLQWSDYRERRPEWVARVQQELFALHEAGKLRPHICARYPLEQFAEALSRFRRRDVQGKMLLLPNQA
jgi:NADPH2:quinone reductase